MYHLYVNFLRWLRVGTHQRRLPGQSGGSRGCYALLRHHGANVRFQMAGEEFSPAAESCPRVGKARLLPVGGSQANSTLSPLLGNSSQSCYMSRGRCVLAAMCGPHYPDLAGQAVGRERAVGGMQGDGEDGGQVDERTRRAPREHQGLG